MDRANLLLNNFHSERLVVMMVKLLVITMMGVTMVLTHQSAHGEEITKEQMKGLDEQIQEIKGDVLTIAAELNHLEEKLLYPSGTQIAMFVSLRANDDFLLDSVEVHLDGEPVAYHLYAYREITALRQGGVQRIFTGNVSSGEHELQVTLAGKVKGGGEIQETESFWIKKSVGPKVVEIALAGPGTAGDTIELKEL